MTLCIALPGAPGPSETFIADHIRSIAPGETILLCRDSHGAERFGCPVTSCFEPWRPPRRFAERIVNAVWHRCHRWRIRSRARVVLPLRVEDRRRVIGFFDLYRPDVVLAEYGSMGCLLVQSCRRAGVPLFVHFHGYDASIVLRDRRRVRQYRSLFRSASGIIVPSRFLAQKLADIGCPTSRLHTSPYGVDTRVFSPASYTKQRRLVAVGRLVEKKAPHLSIQAFAHIAHQYPGTRLDIVGDGPLAAQCQALIAALGLCNRIQMHGAQNREFVAQLMKEGLLFVQHSVTAADGDAEGLPVAILEAMASGLPVISTRHAGIPEAVADGITGLLVEEKDVDAMACAMDELLGNPARAASMGAAGRERVLAYFTREMARDRLRAIMRLRPSAKWAPELGAIGLSILD
ncbi:MAG TPA: glycosyltransferase [Stellaceae bacterium]|nr:glycosyltransferase [Stellaceae bacterium]